MIKVNFRKRDNKIISFYVDGHAEYESEGEIIYDDVVCGVVSALSVVTVNGITDVVQVKKASFRAEEGDIMSDISDCNQEEIDRCQVLLSTVLLGFENLEISYGEYIKVKVEEVQ